MKTTQFLLLTCASLLISSNVVADDARHSETIKQPSIEINLDVLPNSAKSNPTYNNSPFADQVLDKDYKKPEGAKKPIKHKHKKQKKPAAVTTVKPNKTGTAPEVKIVADKPPVQPVPAPLPVAPAIPAMPEAAKPAPKVEKPIISPASSNIPLAIAPEKPLTPPTPILPKIEDLPVAPSTPTPAPTTETKPTSTSITGQFSSFFGSKKTDATPTPPPAPAPIPAPAKPQADIVLPPVLNPPSALPPLPATNALPTPPAPKAAEPAPTPPLPALPPITKTDIETKPLPALPAKVATATPVVPALPTIPEADTSASTADLRITYNETETDVPLSITPKLDAIADQLNKNKTARVTITAYASGTETSGVYPKRVSLARGIAVRNYLTGNKNIDVERVNVKALGNKNDTPPYDRVDISITK